MQSGDRNYPSRREMKRAVRLQLGKKFPKWFHSRKHGMKPLSLLYWQRRNLVALAILGWLGK